MSPRSDAGDSEDAGSSSEVATAEDTERDWRDPLWHTHLNGAMGWGPKIGVDGNGNDIQRSSKQDIGSNEVSTVKQQLKWFPPNSLGGRRMDNSQHPKPVLMVDLNAITGFSPLPNGAEREIIDALNERLYEAEVFDERCETLFEMGAAIHSTEDEAEILICVPGIRHQTIVPYPSNYERLDDLWGRVCALGGIPCLEALLVPLRQCSRSLAWKAAMREEIERLAVREEERFDEDLITEWQQWRRRRELRRLVATRPVFVEQMAKEEQRAKNGSREARAAADGLVHKIAQIDNLVAELELCEIEDGGEALGSDEDEELSNGGDDGLENNLAQSKQMEIKEDGGNSEEEEPSILDAILAMILGRIAPSPGDDPEKHSKMILNWHNEIRTKWKEEFGKLPMDSNTFSAPPKPS